MGNAAFSAGTALISGAKTDSGSTTTGGDTITITAPAGKALDLSRMVIRLRVTATSATDVVIGVGSTYSSVGLGGYTVSLSTSTTGVTYIGGKDFESARFLTTSAQSVILTQATACNIYAEAMMLPSGFTA